MVIEAVAVSIRDGCLRGQLETVVAELARRVMSRPDLGQAVHVESVRTLDEAAVLVDDLGLRLLDGELVVAICGDEDLADIVERHGAIYAQLGAH
jgi:hypothetical protein